MTKCAVCGCSEIQHTRECDVAPGIESRREFCMECDGYMVEIEGIDVPGWQARPKGKAWHRFKPMESGLRELDELGRLG